MNNNNGSKKPLHINELYQPSKNANNSSNQISKNNLKRDNSPNMNKNYSNYSNNNIIQYNPITNNIVKSNYDQKGSPNYNKYVDMVVKNEDDLQKLSVAHEKLINEILTEEEDFINGHRNHIDDMVDVVKQEMMLINEVDKPGSDIDSYVTSLDKLFQEKAEKIQNIRTRLLKFHRMLKEEEILAKKFTDYQNDIEMNENNNFND
jgi:kinesin family protein 2/24